MHKSQPDRPCPIVSEVRIICPNCQALIAIPMNKAVNGEKIYCPSCRREFFFSA